MSIGSISIPRGARGASQPQTSRLLKFLTNIILTSLFLYCCCCCVAKSCPDLLQLHGLQPARLLCPWDSPDKNPGVGCHFFLQGIFPFQRHHTRSTRKWKCQSLSCVQLFVTPWIIAARLCPWNSQGKNTGVGSHLLLQDIFPNQGSNPGLLHCRQML